MAHHIRKGFAEIDRDLVAQLFWGAFRDKLDVTLGPDDTALSFVSSVLNPDFALCAYNSSGQLLGVAGFKTRDGALVDGKFSDLRRSYGWFGALWRALLLWIVERSPEDRILTMDGIFVAASARGQGVGSALLDAIRDEASGRGCRAVRLDVINTNPRARALYLKKGFEPVGIEKTGPFYYIFRFSSSEKMLLHLSSPDT